jgi:hypothetical protein
MNKILCKIQRRLIANDYDGGNVPDAVEIGRQASIASGH